MTGADDAIVALYMPNTERRAVVIPRSRHVTSFWGIKYVTRVEESRWLLCLLLQTSGDTLTLSSGSLIILVEM